MDTKEKEPCWLERLYRAMKRKHWSSEREAIPDAQILIQVAIILTVINVIVITAQVLRLVIQR